MAQLFLNNCYARLATAISATETTLELEDMHGFPASIEGANDFFLVTLYLDGTRYGENFEVVRVNSVSGLTLTVERGYEGVAVPHSVGEPVESRLTAGSMNQLAEQGTVSTTAIDKTLVNGERCFVTAATLTITLPATPIANATVAIGVQAFENTVIARNGKNIMGLAEDMVIDKENTVVTLLYVNATEGWRIV